MLQIYNRHPTEKGPAVNSGWDVEMLFMARKIGAKIDEVQVSWQHQPTNRISVVREGIRGALDLFEIYLANKAGRYSWMETRPARA